MSSNAFHILMILITLYKKLGLYGIAWYCMDFDGFQLILMDSVSIPTMLDNFDHPIILNDGGHLMYYLSSKL